jgi:hypothetical protein
MQGMIEIPAKSGPKGPNKLPPIQAPTIPTIAEVKKPPGIELGTNLSPSEAQTAATIKNRINPSIDMILPPIKLSVYGISVNTTFRIGVI